MHYTRSILISGHVQGVYYRQSAKEKAQSLGINGEVRNLPNGKVAIIATGTQEQLYQLVEWCRQGPPKAIVTAVEEKELGLTEFSDFKVVRG